MNYAASHIGALLVVLCFWACSDNKNALLPVNESDGQVSLHRVLFSEVDAVNASYRDHEGDDDGWIELYNASADTVNLYGLSLTDDLDNPHKWTFGDVKMPPNGYRVVFMSGKNYPDYVAPSDSVDLIGSSCWTWSDSDEDSLGKSYVKPLPGHSNVCFSLNKRPMVGAEMQLADNVKLNWSGAAVMVGAPGRENFAEIDLSRKNEILLTGYVSEGSKLAVRMAQSDMNHWLGYKEVLTGTGDSNTTYSFIVPQKGFPDLAHIYGILFSPENTMSDFVNMKIVSLVARNHGHEPHASFKLNKSGGELFLVDSLGNVADVVRYPAAVTGNTWTAGDVDAGMSSWGYAEPTPGNAAQKVYESMGLVDDLGLKPSGFYRDSVVVKFSREEDVRCEIGGDLPTSRSKKMTSLVLTETTVLRCASFLKGKLPSAVVNRTYVFEERPSVPVVFVTAEPDSLFGMASGIYNEGFNAQKMNLKYGANYWDDREIPGFVELLEPEAKGPAFAENVGLSIFGNASRIFKKKSMAVTFREKYGKSRLHYPLYPEEPSLKTFKSFVLRNNGNNFGVDYVRDMLASSITDGLGLDYQRGRASIVFYNGEYYGIHNIRERSNEYYFETHYGYDPDEIDLLKMDNEVSAGVPTDFVELEKWLETHHLDDEENYAHVTSQIDVDDFLNYVETEIYLNNRDWPGNNLKKWRRNDPRTLWKWFLYDLDMSFDGRFAENASAMFSGNVFEFVTSENTAGWPNGAEYTLLLRRLLENENFRLAFINRMSVLLSMNFDSARVLDKLDELMGIIEKEIPRDQKRWKLNASEMQAELSKIREFALHRGDVVYADLREYFLLDKKVPVELKSEGPGVVVVHGLPLDRASMKVSFFENTPVTLEARAALGGVFIGWSDGLKDCVRIILPGEVTDVTALFR